MQMASLAGPDCRALSSANEKVRQYVAEADQATTRSVKMFDIIMETCYAMETCHVMEMIDVKC